MTLFLLFGISIKDISATELVTHQSLNITKILDGLEGQIEIQRDRRISEKEILAIKDHDPESNPENSLIFKANPLRPGVVRLLAKNKKELSRLNLDKFYASIETEKVNNTGKCIILITQDFGIGMGSYNGLLTKILKIENKKISWEKSYNSKSKKNESISFIRSLKTAWNFSLKNKLGEVDILKVSCRPDER